MTLEAQVERIANYLERIVSKLEGSPVKDETPAEVVPEKVPVRRGRPAKITPEEKAAATVVETEKVEEDFLESAVVAKITIEQVRAALQEYAKLRGKDGTAEARALLTKKGDGAVRLSPAKETPNDVTGVLKPEFYSAVIAAATAK